MKNNIFGIINIINILWQLCIIGFYYINNSGGVNMKDSFFSRVINLINLSLKVDANSTSTVFAYQLKIPKKLKNYKKW